MIIQKKCWIFLFIVHKIPTFSTGFISCAENSWSFLPPQKQQWWGISYTNNNSSLKIHNCSFFLFPLFSSWCRQDFQSAKYIPQLKVHTPIKGGKGLVSAKTALFWGVENFRNYFLISKQLLDIVFSSDITIKNDQNNHKQP